jgi:thiosulfate reductase cytochrome b subunit
MTQRFLALLATVLCSLPAAALPQGAPNAMHPPFAVFDAAGLPVLASRAAPSSDRTCGACHDAAYIDRHNDHNQEGRLAGCVECHFEGSRLPVDPVAFDAQGLLRREAIRISAPKDANCAYCHGMVPMDSAPVAVPDDFTATQAGAPGPRTYALTLHTGEILSPQNLSDSFLNLQDKAAHAYPWDVHARRLVGCTACHFAPNNPAKADLQHTALDFLVRDPRRIATSEFLHRPDHRLVAADCRSCHDATAIHAFLPYRQRHLDTLACQSCHVPRLMGPAARSIDATVVTTYGQPLVDYRGVEARPGESLNSAFSKGYAPFLALRRDRDGQARLAPFNFVTRWYWASAVTGEEVAADVVQTAWRDGDRYRPDLMTALDADRDGSLSDAELRLDSAAKVELVRTRLAALGVEHPEIRGEIHPYAIQHGVVAGTSVRRDCDDCHSENSRTNADIQLAGAGPFGASLPPPASGALRLAGAVVWDAGSRSWVLRRDASTSLYVFGHSRLAWMDRMGWLALAAVLAGILVHGGLRIRAGRRHRPVHAPGKRIYLYSGIERLWHWLMASSVLVLMGTGFEVHFHGHFGLLGLPVAVQIHNFFAAVLLINAFLSLFYHLASKAIRQFLPPRDNLAGELRAQATYYLRGIFLGQPHPTPKSRERKLNPLQQLTYLALLNVLFPFQVLSGALIWGASRWPDFAASIGGLTVIGPLHNLGSLLFLSFLLLHLYLTTTGRTVFSNVAAMVDGWEEVDVADAPAKDGTHG